MTSEYCDYLILGEAEETWPQFLDDFYSGTPTSVYQSLTPPSLTSLPIPKRNLVKNRFWSGGADLFDELTLAAGEFFPAGNDPVEC
jgi:radical SAM superfamily enzyme YgiQ (UPF0313 family)